MPYTASIPLSRWLGERADTIKALAHGHASVGAVTGPGRPLDISKPLAHGYIIVMLSQFQSFVRDLHDVAAEHLVTSSAADADYTSVLVDGLTKGRAIDRGNATERSIKQDFGRLGITPIDVGSRNRRWTHPGGADSRTFNALIELRNALGHGNETQKRAMILSGRARDNVSWARDRLPVLNRYAKALDRIVWDHLVETTEREPWP